MGLENGAETSPLAGRLGSLAPGLLVEALLAQSVAASAAVGAASPLIAAARHPLPLMPCAALAA